MKLELKENMYVRTKDGIIDKVIIDYNVHCANPNCKYKHISCAKNYYDEDKVVKASYNIIDLIEVGDYVNGEKVIHTNCKLEYMDDDSETGVNEVTDGLEVETGWIYFDYEINSVLTKEQFKNIEYRKGE